ncbi:MULTISPECIES: FAD:protein FMN transferase [Psychrilyobacter]|uniref:FAD:protein FMN transferase n=1 Tax=Psychrilyobacter piezotolerans TaxID=2293438 RepID=A0ABX9KDV4_9FUSO|nr:MULTISPECIES: FAD:protein FMN transferase [Psychrilyobacter]MCS5422722.1 FAD:protein FMN transferase [Psychrilyobacter sp. S5]NDI78992.1 FAD:protein FMN transferase [Psychrilyobacter piezotolerans]RDE59213.1 FAD:protein FMN transferase [Psychrilyobacter sp. S5]REI39780.1 FAD:protein FMN transferase [Psychrilyobacter piezotolerans]
MKKILLIFILLLLIGCGKKEKKKIVEKKFAFGTMIDMVVYSENPAKAKKAMDLAFEEIKRIDDKFNTHKEDSLTYKLNHNPGKFFELDSEGLHLFSGVEQIYNVSKTKYDITISPLMKVWGFFDESDRVKIPKKDELEKAVMMVDYSNLEVAGDKIRLKTSKNKIDTGSFLKGYAIHRAKIILAENKVEHAFISAISSIETLNTKPEGESWKVGLQNPEDPSKVYHIVGVDDKSMGVSGDYQIYVEIDGKKYHHLIDKETGYPVRDRKMVVVIGEDGFFADMYSTAFFSMPIEDVIAYVNYTDGLEVMIVKADMSEVYSDGFKKYMIK